MSKSSNKPSIRFRYKARSDGHGRPVPTGMLHSISLDCDPLPFVVSPVDVHSVVQITTVCKFEKEYGNLIRSTPQYPGVGYKVLKSLLAKRSAIHLSTVKWVPDPISVSEKALRKWLDKFDIPAGVPVEYPMIRDCATSLALEAEYGPDLRLRIALGFTGYRAVESYLRKHGIRARHSVVRSWHDLYSRFTPEDEFDCGAEARPVVTESDLRQMNTRMRTWHHVEGLTVSQVVARLREYPLWEGKGVPYTVVRDFYYRNPKYEFDHWQQLLRQPVTGYLQDMKYLWETPALGWTRGGAM